MAIYRINIRIKVRALAKVFLLDQSPLATRLTLPYRLEQFLRLQKIVLCQDLIRDSNNGPTHHKRSNSETHVFLRASKRTHDREETARTPAVLKANFICTLVSASIKSLRTIHLRQVQPPTLKLPSCEFSWIRWATSERGSVRWRKRWTEPSACA
ncbi:hypothetical protein FRC00_005377 [Tulasnella sp. 408]|nr:hypothetical protein FRC00_005377 [Tulasnella sp. 408]